VTLCGPVITLRALVAVVCFALTHCVELVQVRIFESHCGSLTQYGMKHMRAFGNICNSGTADTAMKQASISACGSYNSARWSPLVQGYSA
jgi:hypothetical protein